MHRDVLNRQGEGVGQIEKLMIDVVNGRIAYTVLDTGLLGEYLAVPWHTFNVNLQTQTITLNTDPAKLQKAPRFKRDRWPETVDPQWLADLYIYYGYPQYPGLTEITVQHRRIVRASTLLGLDLRNQQREPLGEIESLMVNTKEGQIAYVILGSGGFLEIGEKHHPIPWETMTIRPVERVAMINLGRDKVQQGPTLPTTRQPETVGHQWLASIYQYYSARPYWENNK